MSTTVAAAARTPIAATFTNAMREALGAAAPPAPEQGDPSGRSSLERGLEAGARVIGGPIGGGVSLALSIKDLFDSGTLSKEQFASGRAPADVHEGQRDAQIDAIWKRILTLSARAAQDPSPGEARAIEARMRELREELSGLQVLDFMVNVARAAGVDEGAIDVLDGATIEVVDELESDAAFQEHPEPKILIRRDVMDRVGTLMDQLIQRGVASEGGGVRYDIKHQPEFIEILNTIALVAVHEETHAEESQGSAPGADVGAPPGVGGAPRAEEPLPAEDQHLLEVFQSWVPWLQALPQLNPATAGRLRHQIASSLLREYIDTKEYEAYVNQEQFFHEELVKVDPQAAQGRTWLTIDAHGRPLPREQAVDNVLAHILETQPGYELEFLDAAMTEGWDLPGWRSPGWRSPGWRSPGTLLPAGPGEQAGAPDAPRPADPAAPPKVGGAPPTSRPAPEAVQGHDLLYRAGMPAATVELA